MEKIKLSSAQFEHHSGDKKYNLSRIDALSAEAANQGSKIIAFHECCITGYTFARNLSREQMLDVAEHLPESESIRSLSSIAKKYDMIILAGLFEKDPEDHLFNTYVCVDKDGLIDRHRKLHPFINPYLQGGDSYTVFEINDWKCGILICYDNNVIENVRATALLGAQIIFMPHVTMCTPSSRPGAGFVDPKLWHNRESDPTSLRSEFDGLKGRQWLMKWLPARAYDNAVYVVFSNPIGMDDDQLKNGCSMVIDPFGDILAECRMLEDGLDSTTLIPQKIYDAGGYRYRNARRPALYHDILTRKHQANLDVAWLKPEKTNKIEDSSNQGT